MNLNVLFLLNTYTKTNKIFWKKILQKCKQKFSQLQNILKKRGFLI